MAVSVSAYKATSKVLVGKLVPFFVAGDKVLKFLSAIAKPLDTVNTAFLSWAKDTLIDAATTSQVIVLEWSMTQKLQKYFVDSAQSVSINTWGRSDYTTIVEDETERSNSTTQTWLKDIYSPETQSDSKIPSSAEQIIVRDKWEITNEGTDIIVRLPKQKSSLSDEAYIKKAKQCIEPYLAYEMDYTIKINNS